MLFVLANKSKCVFILLACLKLVSVLCSILSKYCTKYYYLFMLTSKDRIHHFVVTRAQKNYRSRSILSHHSGSQTVNAFPKSRSCTRHMEIAE